MPKKQSTKPVLSKVSDLAPVTFITSGIDEIDKITGGLPISKITEIYGTTGAGKTSLTLKCISKISQQAKVLFIDAENALNPAFLTKEANLDNISISTEYVLEEAADLTIALVNKYDVIVVDSVASLLPRAESDGEFGDQLIGLKARLMGKWMRKIIGPLGKSKCALLFINQLRDSPNMYAPRFTPGGHALEYAASLRIELSTKKADRIIKDGIGVGHKVTAEITKSRVCNPHQTTQFTLNYN